MYRRFVVGVRSGWYLKIPFGFTYAQRQAIQEGYKICMVLMRKWANKWVVVTNDEDEIGRELRCILPLHRMRVISLRPLRHITSSVTYPALHPLCELRKARVSVFIHNCGCCIRTRRGNLASNSRILEFSKATEDIIVEAFHTMIAQGTRDGIIIVLFSNVDPPKANAGDGSSPKQIVQDAVDSARIQMLSERGRHNIRLLTLSYDVLTMEKKRNQAFPTNKDVARAVMAILTADLSEVLADNILTPVQR